MPAMSIDQIISLTASVGACLAAVATFLTVWQIAKQRRATYSPEIIVMRANVLSTGDLKNPDLKSLLNWKRSDDEEDTRTDFMGRNYPLFLVNIGMGSATNVLATWDFPLEAFVAYVRELENAHGYPLDIEYSNGTVRVSRQQDIASFWNSQRVKHFDYILATSVKSEPTEISLPHSYILAVSICADVFVRNYDESGPKVPPLKLSLKFYDIAGKKHRMSYNIHFVWPDATPYVFEAELVPIRV
jgi:hypothetical protein